jgi:hypothetical protein
MSTAWKQRAVVFAGIALFIMLAWNEHRIVRILLSDGVPLSTVAYQRGIIWLGALGTLAVYSFLIRSNPFYHLFEHALLGCATGMGIAIALQDALIARWWLPMTAGFRLLASEGMSPEAMNGVVLLIPGAIGLLWYFQFSKRFFWISRIPMVIGLGAGAGLAFKDMFNRILPQISGTLKTLWPREAVLPGAGNWARAAVGAENLIFVVGTLSVLAYFFFAFGRNTVAVRAPARLGRWYLMLSLGAFFGNTFMSRLSALIERVHFLCSEWLRWSALW